MKRTALIVAALLAASTAGCYSLGPAERASVRANRAIATATAEKHRAGEMTTEQVQSYLDLDAAMWAEFDMILGGEPGGAP